MAWCSGTTLPLPFIICNFKSSDGSVIPEEL